MSAYETPPAAPESTNGPHFAPPHFAPRHFAPAPLPFRMSSSNNTWMITFTDLIALMLTFFVLLFSMSQLQQQKWQSLVESLASNLSATYKTETAKFAADYQVEAPIVPPGADLDYLEPILREHFAEDPMLKDGSIDRAEGGLIVFFPDERLFVGNTPELTTRGAKVIFALGSVLRNLDNAVDVNAGIRSGATIVSADWETALARSVAVVRILAQSGFAGPAVARGLGGDDKPGSRGHNADGLTLLVREDQRG